MRTETETVTTARGEWQGAAGVSSWTICQRNGLEKRKVLQHERVNEVFKLLAA